MEQLSGNINMVVENQNTENKPPIKRDFAPHRRVSIRICKECGKTWILNDSDATYYIQKFGTLPLRCEECRKKNLNSHEPIE